MPGWLGDTLRLNMFKLPLFVGSTWETLAYSWDTTVSLEVETNFWLPFLWELTMNATTEVLNTTGYMYGGMQRECFENLITSFGNSTARIDTTIENFITAGDTVGFTHTETTNRQYINTYFTIPLESHEIEVKYDTNYFDTTAARDTTIKHTTLTSWYHPVLDRVISRE
jgi:hypothetical protein